MDATPDNGLERIPAATGENGLDCVTCGACCHGLAVRVDPDDSDRFSGRELALWTRMDEDGLRWMRARANKACVCLDVDGARKLCTIYDRRPGVCAAFEPGTKDCLEARRAHGLDAPG